MSTMTKQDSATQPASDSSASFIQPNDTVLLIGDSVTDANRQPENYNLGAGYAMMIAGWYSALLPENRVVFLNRGVSGDRLKDLKARWDKDVLQFKPQVVSILIGVNDMLRRWDGTNEITTPEMFEADYLDILTRTRDVLQARIVLVEPFIVPVPDSPYTDRWQERRADLENKIAVVKHLAPLFDAVLVPMDSIFQVACTRRKPSFWVGDGVHLAPAGSALLAQTWLKAVGVLP